MLGQDFFKTAARMGSGARDLMGSMAGEIERLVKARVEARLKGLNLVSREEFEAVKMLAEEARSRVDALEKRLGERGGKATATTSGAAGAKKKKEPKE